MVILWSYERNKPKVPPAQLHEDTRRMGFDKQAVVVKQRLHETDTGSTRVQVALLTERINSLTDHFRTHPKAACSRWLAPVAGC
jgi:Ribosomal protein S15